MNKGLIPGLNPDGWRTFRPRLLTAGAGGETQPVVPDAGSLSIPFGRYTIIDKALAIVEIQMSFTGSFNVGVGAAYVLSLPFPAHRWSGPGASAPTPLGVGMCYFSFASPQPATNMPVTVTLADPFASLAGQEDSYVQCYCPTILSWGTTQIVTGGTVTVTHQCGYAPRAEDVDIIPLDIDANGTSGPVSVQNITTTTFDIVLRSGTGVDFAWKVRGKPPQASGSHGGPLMSPTTPWDWTRGTFLGPFGNIFISLAYEPKN